jgi:hypothetical protein
MTSQLIHDKTTGVAFIDVNEATPGAKIRVSEVSDLLGLKSQVRARYDVETGTLLGLVIEDYPSFRREIMWKYVAFRVEKIVDLIVCSVKMSLEHDHSDRPRLVAAV